MGVAAGAELPDDIYIQHLGPLDYFPGARSCIEGLGGTEPPHHPAYGFHTLYAACDEGPEVFVVRFRGLAAEGGQLTLSINALPDRPDAVIYTAVSQNIPFRNLLLDDGIAFVRFEATPRTHYALLGYIHDGTKVRAEDLEIRLYRAADLQEYSDRLIRTRRTNFGSSTVRPVARLRSYDRPTLAEPVSQIRTASQMDEPVYDEWLAAMHAGADHDPAWWGRAYILQALRRYGMLEEGARGIGFGVGREPLPAVMAARGCSILATDLADAGDAGAFAGIDGLRRPALCDDAAFDLSVSYRPVDMRAIPGEIAGHDFLWSAFALDHLGSVEAGQRFVEESLLCLKPGGVAAHAMAFEHDHGSGIVADGGEAPFRRADLDRLALSLISRGHEVAQLKYDAGSDAGDAAGAGGRMSFGLIVRRGLET